MKSFKVGACSAALVIALAVAGCGSSDDDSSSDDSSTAEISKTDFVTQANAICKSSNEAMDSAQEKVLSSQPTQAEIEDFVTSTVIPQVETQISGIRELGVPEGDEDQVNALLDEAESAAEEVKSDPASATEEGSDPFAEANKLADEYGLTECAS